VLPSWQETKGFALVMWLVSGESEMAAVIMEQLVIQE
jgi:hypothetical protein